MIAVDTSVLVAAFASWHESHAAARDALQGARVVAHSVVETYSVLTRLPPPHRVVPGLAAEFLRQVTTAPPLALPAEEVARLPHLLAGQGISGGAAYDALIAVTALQHGADLVSLDARAAATYRAVGAAHRLLG
ncbi:Predicted nucleic acid-binding protein, contains PIN domain [Geodermatophilus saharensis]|uniref:Ribonuclease VapC n=1 Tax=Geodermatophilus saharensis TaxID=1137994 RepID=A0A239FGN5_9ACTN|nr:PIN domain-containing protein [Geodermatophilus saharensis]SNS55921.1 Predicted nucleic acid-binding protein, contains PIN domain [Geodermatophilus saharensis]